MKLYFQFLKLLWNKVILRKKTGMVIKEFATNMGIVYIKLAQMLATQNFGNFFTEEDREMLSSICDDCNEIPYNEIKAILTQEYGTNLHNIFQQIDKKALGAASVSQVHRAILKTGEEVAIKIKRKDVTKTLEKDINRIRKLVHRYGKFVKFKNYTGGDHALNLYLDWIHQETDFIQEKENIKIYQNFANTVNNKVCGTKLIKVPKVYEEYCTDNIIVMEFIKAKTINHLELTEDIKEKIVNALNSYIKLSFWAMFHDKKIVFHGDPHSGNISIDENGNICFLDMGLLCVMNAEDAELCKRFFLAAYSGNFEKMYNMLVQFGNMKENEKKSFKNECKKYCEEIKQKDITYYFVDMLNICLNYEFVPPNFLFQMAKAFVCLNGINNFTNNPYNAIDLLQEQTLEFLINRSLLDGKKIMIDNLKIAPIILENALGFGIVKTISQLSTNQKLRKNIRNSLENFKEMLDLMKLTNYDESVQNRQRKKCDKNSI